MTHNLERLKAHILPLSLSQDFAAARLEWELVRVEISEEFDTCPCGKDIKEHCFIRNRYTKSETYVGNVCINRFIGIDTGSVFDGLRRVKANNDAAPNLALIDHADTQGYLYEKEYDFLKNTARKRDLSQSQLEWRQKINRRIIAQTVVKKRGDARPSQTP